MSRPVRWLIGGLVGGFVVWRCWTPSRLGDGQRHWAIVAVVVLGIVVADVLPDVRTVLGEPSTTLLVALVSLAAIYGCVPETDQIPTVGVVLALLAMIELVTKRPAPLPVHGAAFAFVLWSGVFGATGRERALIGAVFAFWPVVLVAIVFRLRPTIRATHLVARLTVPSIGGAAALLVARTGALQDGRRPALRDAAIAGAASLAVACAVGVAVTRARPAPPTS